MKIPYALVAAVNIEQRQAQMLHAIAQGFPRFRPTPIDERASLTIACYGPSLADTYQSMTRPILSMSGATRFLADRGVVPEFHIDMDPRAHKTKFIDPPIPGVHYLMASVCPPRTWELLKGERVTLWHAKSNEDTLTWLSQHDHGELMIDGGSSIGLASLHVGGLLGYRHFEIHGMDGSIRDGQRHAGPHYGHQQGGITWAAGGVTYQTSRIMSNSTAEMINALRFFPMLCVFHGDGLTQALVRETNLENACCADEFEKAERVRTATVNILPIPLFNPKQVKSPFEALLTSPPNHWIEDLRKEADQAAARRARAHYNTGSLGAAAAFMLRTLAEVLRPAVTIEVGTFIGTSTEALRHGSGHIYTCDRSNDCYPSSDQVTTFPRRSATEMFAELLARGVKADLFFFDGRLTAADVPLILRLSKPGTVYVFDDYEPGGKGAANVPLLRPFLPGVRVLVPPPQPPPGLGGPLTLASLWPEAA